MEGKEKLGAAGQGAVLVLPGFSGQFWLGGPELLLEF
jgi:hypothetical protein